MADPFHARALAEIGAVFEGIDDASVEALVAELAGARHVAVYGAGREGLQMRGLAMRLFHLGRSASVVGDMTAPAVGPGDLFLVSSGPGELTTALALAAIAKAAGARVLVVTAQAGATLPKRADAVLVLPAQTMADDRGETPSLLPMGSVYEGALFVLFEVVVLRLKARLGVSAEVMRANHTNLE